MQNRFIGRSLFIVFFVHFFSASMLAVNLSRVDFGYQYDKGPVKVSHRVANLDDQYRLTLLFNLRKIKTADHVENMRIFSQSKYDDKEEQKIVIEGAKSDSSGNVVSIDLQFVIPTSQNYIVIEFNFLEKQYYYTIAINNALKFPLSDISVKNTASLDKLVFKKGDSLILSSMSGQNKFVAYLYRDNFPASAPPMAEMANGGNEQLEIELIGLGDTGWIVDRENYLYFIQNDTSTDRGISFLTLPKSYPKFRTAEELVRPLIYLCTTSEYEKLVTASDQKKAFSDFWINLLKSKTLASKSIQLYYRSVKEANAYFSNHKIGWKTDQGMVYIVFGPPEEVERKEDKEIWTYSTFEGKINFTFAKKPNLFVHHHYQLERKKNLSKHWFNAVQKWRRGNI